jgi:hypothetical protein
MIAALAIGALTLSALSEQDDLFLRMWYLRNPEGYADLLVEQGVDTAPVFARLKEVAKRARTLDELFAIDQFILALANRVNRAKRRARGFISAIQLEDVIPEVGILPSRPIEWSTARSGQISVDQLMRNDRFKATHQIFDLSTIPESWDIVLGWDATRIIVATDLGSDIETMAVIPRPVLDHHQRFIDRAGWKERRKYERESLERAMKKS